MSYHRTSRTARCSTLAFLISFAVITTQASTASAQYDSHPPMRSVPEASDRPRNDGPARFVDPVDGDDANDGSESAPWLTLGHAVERLEPGVTLYLRGGTHWAFRQVMIGPDQSGEPNAPVTIRSYPGELAIVDFGFREFFEDPASSWEPYPEGATGEYRSTGTYEYLPPDLCGNFADSMIPFFRYRFFEDLRSDNEYWHAGLTNRQRDPDGIYAGPGVLWDETTGRLHIRLGHTNLPSRGSANYTGETDPRNLQLVVCRGDDPARFRLQGARHVRVYDLVIRGSERNSVRVVDSEQIHLEGLWVYGGSPALQVDGTGIRVLQSKFRGFDAPWHSRAHDKNRSGSGYLAMIGGTDIEIAHNEFTDHHDGILFKVGESWVGELSFHHNLVSNMNDDGLFMSERRESATWLVHQNVISGCVQCLAHPGGGGYVGTPAEGAGNYVFRNVFDLRRWTYGSPPLADDPDGDGLRDSLLAGDHGAPVWPDYYFYQNTVVSRNGANGNPYAFEMGGHTDDTIRRVFNNVFAQIEGIPGQTLPPPGHDFAAGGNLFWGVRDGSSGDEPDDVYADPKFVAFPDSWRDPTDFRLTDSSPAIDAGVEIPSAWPDPLRSDDSGAPDIGALPFGTDQLPGPGEAPENPDQSPDPEGRPDAGVGTGDAGDETGDDGDEGYDSPDQPRAMDEDGGAACGCSSRPDGRASILAFLVVMGMYLRRKRRLAVYVS